MLSKVSDICKKIFHEIKKPVNGEYVHFCGNVKRDKSGRLRHKVYINGETPKEEVCVDGWLFIPEGSDPEFYIGREF